MIYDKLGLWILNILGILINLIIYLNDFKDLIKLGIDKFKVFYVLGFIFVDLEG